METSSQESLATREQRIASDKLAKFRGAARISIQHLDFPHPTRQIDRKVIRQLIRDFDGEGCIREEPNHRIPAIIDNWILQAALEKISLTAETFRREADNPPILELESGVKLECLHGQHRVLAAKEHLAASQRWWVVDIYGADLNQDTKQMLREGYSYSAQYTSGEMFRYMRLCHYDNDPLGAQRWRGRFSPSQDDFLEQLFKRTILVTALDSILHIQGLWREFYIGSLDVFLFPKCDEEISNYIRCIKAILTRILNGDMAIMMQVDPITIESIQSRSPALSKSDYEFIQQNMKSGELFPGVVDPIKRADITQRLLATQELIPSLYTLIKDIRYLKQPAQFLIKFLPKSPKKTLRQRWFHNFDTKSSDGTVQIQQGSFGSYATFPSAHLDSFDICYQQLWLCSYRVCKYPNAYGRLQLAELAYRLGFSTPKIAFELSQDPAQAMIEKTLEDVFHILRPNENFNFDAKKASRVIGSFKEYLNGLKTTAINTTSPPVTVVGTGTPLSYRCGYGPMDTRDLAHLFLDKINAPLPEYRKDGGEISSFYVKRSRHIAFFGAIDLPGNQEGSSTHLVSASSSLDHQRLRASPPPIEVSSSITSSNHQESSQNEEVGSNQVAVSKGVVKFVEDGMILQEVPFREEDVNIQAREFADQGRKLSVEDSTHFLWQDCFNILIRTRKSIVIVATVTESRAGKRRRGEDLPERFQPATKEAFDFSMAEDEEQL